VDQTADFSGTDGLKGTKRNTSASDRLPPSGLSLPLSQERTFHSQHYATDEAELKHRAVSRFIFMLRTRAIKKLGYIPLSFLIDGDLQLNTGFKAVRSRHPARTRSEAGAGV
jgi:hypothetical protein